MTARIITMSFFFGPSASEGTGSGFIYDEAGHIVTNFHVIAAIICPLSHVALSLILAACRPKEREFNNLHKYPLSRSLKLTIQFRTLFNRQP